jgi:putative transposase
LANLPDEPSGADRGHHFFTVPTATFRILFVFVVLAQERRRVLHFGVTEHPTEQWTMQHMREAFPWDEAPRHVLRDRDAIYGRDFSAMTRDMGMEEVLIAPRSPPGKIPLRNGWWAPSEASAWTT